MTQKIVCRGGRCVDLDVECEIEYSDPVDVMNCRRMKEEFAE